MHPTDTASSLYQTNEMAVFALLSKLDTSKATSTEDFPKWVSKNNAHLIMQPMSNIINTVLKSGHFPRLWKHAEITPLKKVKSPKLSNFLDQFLSSFIWRKSQNLLYLASSNKSYHHWKINLLILKT
jgi:hypothetical protein